MSFPSLQGWVKEKSTYELTFSKRFIKTLWGKGPF